MFFFDMAVKNCYNIGEVQGSTSFGDISPNVTETTDESITIDTFKNEYIEYTEAIIFSYNANKPRKLLTPKIAIIYKQPEIQALYIIAEENHKKGEIIFETHCMCGGGTFTQNLDYLPFSSDIPEFQAYMEQHIGG